MDDQVKSWWRLIKLQVEALLEECTPNSTMSISAKYFTKLLICIFVFIGKCSFRLLKWVKFQWSSDWKVCTYNGWKNIWAKLSYPSSKHERITMIQTATCHSRDWWRRMNILHQHHHHPQQQQQHWGGWWTLRYLRTWCRLFCCIESQLRWDGPCDQTLHRYGGNRMYSIGPQSHSEQPSLNLAV